MLFAQSQMTAPVSSLAMCQTTRPLKLQTMYLPIGGLRRAYTLTAEEVGRGLLEGGRGWDGEAGEIESMR